MNTVHFNQTDSSLFLPESKIVNSVTDIAKLLEDVNELKSNLEDLKVKNIELTNEIEELKNRKTILPLPDYSGRGWQGGYLGRLRAQQLPNKAKNKPAGWIAPADGVLTLGLNGDGYLYEIYIAGPVEVDTGGLVGELTRYPAAQVNNKWVTFESGNPSYFEASNYCFHPSAINHEDLEKYQVAKTFNWYKNVSSQIQLIVSQGDCVCLCYESENKNANARGGGGRLNCDGTIGRDRYWGGPAVYRFDPFKV